MTERIERARGAGRHWGAWMRRGGVLLLASCLAACSGLSQKPEISLVGIELVGWGLFEQRFKLQLEVHNPNASSLSVEALDFEIELNGEHFARGASTAALVVPAQGQAMLDLPTTTRLDTLVRQLKALQQAGRSTAEYRIVGNATLATIGRVPFERKGEIALGAFERLLPKAPPR